MRLLPNHELVPVCPEILGGLPTPRPPAERVGKRVLREDGSDVTAEYQKGAEEVLKLCRLYGARTALLKAKSPACGAGEIYDGTFSRTLREGDGVLASLLKENGIRVLTENDIEIIEKENL